MIVAAVVVALALALLLSALFSAAELSIFSLGDARIRTLVEEGFQGATALERLRERPERVLVLLRAGDVLADTCAAGLAAYLGYSLGSVAGLIVAVAVAAALVLLLGDLVPMRLAVSAGVRLALGSAPTLDRLSRGLGPVLGLLGRVGQIRPSETVGALASSAERQVRELAALGHMEGVIDEQEHQLMERVFRLDETRAWDIMTPRVDVFAWDESRALAAIAPDLGTVSYSRVPVYRDSIDNITGVLYIRDAYQALIAGQRDVPLRELSREPLIVPGSLSLTTLLRDFQTRRIHLAVVVDEYGGTDGVVTLEDVLEELVGEIVDETDVAYEPMTRVTRHEVVAAGDADLREINHFFNASLPQLEHRSLNGYLLEEFGRVPAAGESIDRHGLAIEVLEATETQVLRARIRRQANPETRAQTGENDAAARSPQGDHEDPAPEPTQQGGSGEPRGSSGGGGPAPAARVARGRREDAP